MFGSCMCSQGSGREPFSEGYNTTDVDQLTHWLSWDYQSLDTICMSSKESKWVRTRDCKIWQKDSLLALKSSSVSFGSGFWTPARTAKETTPRSRFKEWYPVGLDHGLNMFSLKTVKKKLTRAKTCVTIMTVIQGGFSISIASIKLLSKYLPKWHSVKSSL